MIVLGIFQDWSDPAACLVQDGRIVAYAEEERFIRIKHARGMFPSESVKFCLRAGGIDLEHVDAVAQGFDCPRHADGSIADHYAWVEKSYPIDERTRRWHQQNLKYFHPAQHETMTAQRLRRLFGHHVKVPPMRYVPHHYAHAFQAFMMSEFDDALVLTIDGSGDDHCTVIWHGHGTRIDPLREFKVPDSLGWFYAGITEYLGFEAYDGEYKVMGLAAYGKPDPALIDKMRRVVVPAPDEVGYTLDPTYIFYGCHTHSERFTDRLPQLLDRAPRLPSEPLDAWHQDVAFAAQHVLEETVVRLVGHYARETGLRKLCVGGGVGMNVKLNTRLYGTAGLDDIYIQPICNDSGTAIGAAQAVVFQDTGVRPEPRWDLYFGPADTDIEIESQLKECGVRYRRLTHRAKDIAALLAQGRIVAVLDGAMEGGPRALGARSILADPRDAANRDRVNAVIKYREYWRPFCPAVLAERAAEYMVRPTRAPFMIIAFDATERCRREAPAVVHVDGTCRAQLVEKETHPRFHDVIAEFCALTGVPMVLNTSFNIKGEPMVCSVRDALRTYFSTGLDDLVVGSFLVEK
jgi:carbamoyltransferase